MECERHRFDGHKSSNSEFGEHHMRQYFQYQPCMVLFSSFAYFLRIISRAERKVLHTLRGPAGTPVCS
jgi:hypothetical protein